MPAAERGPTTTLDVQRRPARAGRGIETEVLEGRPPKTLDSLADDGSTLHYCLEGWAQSGRSAVYTFLYRVQCLRSQLPHVAPGAPFAVQALVQVDEIGG